MKGLILSGGAGTRLRPQLREDIAKAQAEDLLTPSVAWGYFPVNSEGNNLIVWTDDDRTTERVHFNFPRQGGPPRP